MSRIGTRIPAAAEALECGLCRGGEDRYLIEHGLYHYIVHDEVVPCTEAVPDELRCPLRGGIFT